MSEREMTDLQARLAHQERTLDDLSDVVAAQAREIDRLQTRLEAAERALRDMADAFERATAAGHPPEKPPHY
jgi:SlyX protein